MWYCYVNCQQYHDNEDNNNIYIIIYIYIYIYIYYYPVNVKCQCLWCCHHGRAIARVHPVHMMNVEWRQAAADPRPSQTT